MSEKRVMTEFGPGVIVASETVRGSTSYKVEGPGFSVWRTAQQIPEFGQLQWDGSENHKWDNSTTLPYNPRPQFYPRDGFSTIQPNQHVDPDRRLTPADSVSFEERPDSNAPGPNPQLFAAVDGEYNDYSPLDAAQNPDSWPDEPGQFANPKDFLDQMPDWEAEERLWSNDPVREYNSSRTAGWESSTDDPDDQSYASGSFRADLIHSVSGQWKVVYYENGIRQTVDGKGYDTFSSESEAKAVAEQTIREWEHGVSYPVASIHEGVDTSWSDSTSDSGSGAMNDAGTSAPVGSGTLDPIVQDTPGHLTTQDPYAQQDQQDQMQQTTQAPTTAALTDAELQERLGDKFAAVNPFVEHSSLQSKLDDDPYRVLSDIRMSNLEKFQEDPRVREALLLEQADKEIRTAAWTDVRQKAIRLRSSGNIQLEAANPVAIVATVTGDHGIYEVAVIKGNAVNGSSAVTDWTCSCPWGDWAFERQHTFVGRLCSHAYAALLEHQSLTQRGEKPYGWSDKVSNRTASWPPQKGEAEEEQDNQNPVDQPTDDDQQAPPADPNAQQPPADPNAQQAPPPADPNAAPADPNAAPADPNAGADPAAAGGALGDEQSVADEVTQTLQEGGYDPAQYDVQAIAHDMYVWSDAGGGFIPRTDDENEFWSTVDGHATGGETDPNAQQAPPPNIQSARYPRSDGKLQTEPGTLTPDLHYIPKARSVTRVDLSYSEIGRLTQAERDLLVNAGVIEADLPNHKEPHDEPFQGSGPINDDPSFSTSEQYVTNYEDTRPGHSHTDVDELSTGDPDTGGVQGVVAAHEESDGQENFGEESVDVEDDSDVVASFQREAGSYLMESNGGGGGGDDKIAQAAQAFLEKTAGRKFTLREQQELIEEAALDGPIDQGDLDLRNTHYLP